MKNALIFLFGGAVGASLSGIFVKKYLEKKYDEKLEAEIRKLEEDFAEMDPDLYKKRREKVGQREKETKKPNEEVKKAAKEAKEYIKTKREPINYKAYYTKEEKEESIDDGSEELFEEHQKNRTKKPKIISAEALGDVPPSYDEEILTYYTEDDLLVTEENEVIEDVQRLIGDALTKYNFAKNDEKVIFVQNFELNTVYEIEKVWGSYVDF